MFPHYKLQTHPAAIITINRRRVHLWCTLRVPVIHTHLADIHHFRTYPPSNRLTCQTSHPNQHLCCFFLFVEFCNARHFAADNLPVAQLSLPYFVSSSRASLQNPFSCERTETNNPASKFISYHPCNRRRSDYRIFSGARLHCHN